MVRTLPAALEKFKWKPGQSGNPTGNAPVARELRKAFRSYSYVALNILLDLLTCDEPATRFRAAEAILTRGFGKGEAVVPEDKEDEGPQASDAGATYNWSLLTNDEWRRFKEIQTEMKGLLAKATVKTVAGE